MTPRAASPFALPGLALLLAWGPPAPAQAPPVPAPRFEASATLVRPGQSVLLRWDCPGVDQVRLEPGGLVSGARGQLTVSPGATLVYALHEARPGGRRLAALRVVVEVAAPPGEVAKVCSFTASSSAVRPGEPVVLKWECSGSAKVRLEPGGLELDGLDQVTVTPLETTLYTLSVSNLAGGTSRSLQVQVSPAPALGDPARVCSFTADRAAVKPGEPVELRWECQGEARVRLDPLGLELQGQDRVVVHPDATTVYTLNVSNLAGGHSRSLEVRVSAAPERPLSPAIRRQALEGADLAEALRQGAAERARHPGNPWTLRLVVSGRAEGLKALARAAGPAAEDLMVLPYLRKDGLRWWQALFGAFPSRAEAQGAWARLPESLRRAFPDPLPLRLGRLPGDPPPGSAAQPPPDRAPQGAQLRQP